MFEDIINQDLAKRILESRIRNNKLPSALLFHGPEGVGKRTFALTVMRVVTCAEVEYGYCGECGSCKAIGNLVHPNLRMLFPVRNAGSLEGLPDPELYDEQGTITIDMVRILRREASLKPFQEGKRIFVVLDADRMTQEAANAFLKLLEEPPADTLLILTTTRLSFLFATILSRCQSVRFTRLPPCDIENALVERMSADRHKARLAASLSDGSLGRAQRLLKEYAEEHRRRLFDFVSEDAPQDDLAVLDFTQELVSENLVHDTLEVLQSMYRDMLAVKMGARDTVTNTDQMEGLDKGATRMGCEEIHDIIYRIEDAADDLNRNVSPKLVLFNLLSRVHERNLSRA
ncbi:MAG: ATP-binding protein [bacterium]